MLKFGLFEDFKGADTLLIWGDADGLLRFRELLTGLSTGTEKRLALHAMERVEGHSGLTVDFELSANKLGALRIVRRAGGTAIRASYSAEQFTEFADKIAVLASAGIQPGHQYLDWLGMADVRIMVSKDEYPPGFGALK